MNVIALDQIFEGGVVEVQAEDAILVDSSDMTAKEVTDTITGLARERKKA